MQRRDYRRVFVEPRDSYHCIVDVGGLNDTTTTLLMHHSVKAAEGCEIDDHTHTIRQNKITRYDVVGARRLNPAMSHVEQADKIKSWLANSPASVVLNIMDIGEPASRSFRALRPNHFNMPKADAAEFLHSLILAKLNDHTLRIADDLALRIGDLNCERVGDARACAIGIWAASQVSTSEPLRI